MNEVALQDIVALVGTVLGLGGLAFGLYQYRVAQKWKQSELAAKQLEKLSSDHRLAMCCLFLDWATRRIPVPDDYRIYGDGEQDYFVHKWDTLAQAMRPESERESFPFPQVLYRDYFDHFFAYLELVNHYLRINLFSLSDVSSLNYWLEQVAYPPNAPESERDSLFRNFVRYYGYAGVEELMYRFGIAFQENQRVVPERVEEISDKKEPSDTTLPRARESVGWLVMHKEKESGTSIIEVQKEGNSIHLERPDGEPVSHLVSAGRPMPWRDEPVKLWTKEAAMVWEDLTIERSRFQPRYQGYPKEERLRKLLGLEKRNF